MRRRPPGTDRSAYHAVRVGAAVLVVADSTSAAVLPIFIIDVTDDLGLAGLIISVSIIGGLAAGIAAGPAIDSIGLRRTIALSGMLVTATAVALYTTWLAGLLSTAALLVLFFLHASADEPGRTAMLGIVPSLAARAGVTVESANATLRAVNGIGGLVGPIIAAAAVLALGSPTVLLLTGLAGAVATVTIVVVLRRAGIAEPADRADGPADPHDAGASYLARFRSGARLLVADRTLLTVVLTTTVFMAFDTAFATIGLTAYARDQLGDVTFFAALVSAFGLGSLLGTLLFGALGHRLRHRRLLYLGSYLLFAVVVLGLAADLGPWTAVAMMAVGGVVTSPIDMIYLQALQRRVPTAMFGRVSSIATTVTSGPTPLMVSAMTGLIVTLGVRAVFVLLGCLYAAVALGLVLCRPLRGLDDDVEEVTGRAGTAPGSGPRDRGRRPPSG